MAKIYDKPLSVGEDRTLILNSREALLYPFPFKDWNIIRIGAWVSFTNVSSDNVDIGTAFGTNVFSVLVSHISDRLMWGVKPNSSNFPVEDNQPFLGLFSAGTQSDISMGYSAFPGSITLGGPSPAQMNYGTIHSNNTMGPASSGIIAGAVVGNPPANTMGDTSQFCFFFGLVLSINNKGLTNQTVNISSSFATLNTSDTGDASLKDAMLNATYTDMGMADWNLSGTPYVLPDSLFFYMPFSNVRLRLHNMGVLRVS
jgi:hypothetical protein